jgi:dienelactone hydrolase
MPGRSRLRCFTPFWAVVVVAGCNHGSVTAQAPPGSAVSPEEQQARSFLADVAEGKWAAAVRLFDARMAREMPEDRLASFWQQMLAIEGTWVGIEHLSTDRAAVSAVVAADLRFSRPAYVDLGAFEEREVMVGSSPALPGVLTLPKGAAPVPAVVLVHGSGPSDRDETIGGTKVFRDLSLGLATRQIASMRYDKRTFVDPRGVVTEKEEVIDGALAAIALLRSTPGIDSSRVVIVGHSQGGALAPRIAQLDGGVAGIVVLAGPTRPVEVATLAQAEYLRAMNPGKETLEQLLAQSREFKTQVEASDLRPDTKVEIPGGGSALGAYFLAARGYHPETLAASLPCPILVIQGGRDYQVTEQDDFSRWRAALAGDVRATLRTYPELDHRLVAGEGPSSPAQYSVPAHVDARVVVDIVSWIARTSNAPRRESPVAPPEATRPSVPRPM